MYGRGIAMKVRTKLLITAAIGIVLLVSMTVLILYLLIIAYIDKEEAFYISRSYSSTNSILHKEQVSLESIALDWSEWDDTYNFINEKNDQYIDINLLDGTLVSLNINFMYFIKKDDANVYLKNYAIQDSDGLLLEKIIHSKVREINSKVKMDELKPVTGLVSVSDRLMVVSIAPVTTSDGNAPINGFIAIGRYIDKEFIKYLEKVLQVQVNIDILKEPLQNKKGYEVIRNEECLIWLSKTNDNITSYSYINDIFGKPVIALRLDMDRTNHRNGINAIHLFSIFFLISMLAVIGMFFIFFDGSILKRLEKLHNFLDRVSRSRDTKASISLPGNDEISRLATNTNIMLKEIDSFYEEIRIMEERFRLILEATNDGYFDVNIPGNEIYISPAWLNYVGFPDNRGYINYNTIIKSIHPGDRNIIRNALEDCFAGKIEYLRVEYRVATSKHEWIWIVNRGKVVEFDNMGKPIRLMGTITDISKRKTFEAQNTYLSQTDVVTNLKNRTYMEDILKKVSEFENYNSWIIMGDINGLKSINDNYGHNEGDRLLNAVGGILLRCCSGEDIPARWGGDEFIIFVKNNNSEYVENLIRNIKNECSNIKDCAVAVSIAMGRAKKERGNTDIGPALKQAEERMYRNKLLESRSARSSIIASLEQSLHEKNIETEEHTKRIKYLCKLIGLKMGLIQEEMDELSLLGVLHDIGKIGIPESILLKSEKLSDKEWEIMKTHSEIGYRIAVSTPDFAHIANDILHHHERYDGTGYPHKLTGKNIPKLSRLLAIADSFDVMTHERHYKSAMSIENAVLELKKCSGKQFDPEMVEQFLSLLDENILDNVC